MRVLLVGDWNRGRGGAEAHILALRDGLRAAGDAVRLLTSSAGTSGDGTAEYVAYGSERAAAQVFLQIANPSAIACVRRAVREFRPDVTLVNMFAHHLSPAVLFALDGAPIVLLVSDYKCVCPVGSKLLPDGSICAVPAGLVCWRSGCVNAAHWLRDQPRYALIRAGLRRVARVVACSAWVRDELARNGIHAEVLLLPGPRGPGARFERRPAPEPLFLFVGRLDREKGVELLLRAFARVRRRFASARLRIAGQGPLRGHLEGIARALGVTDAVEFCGWLSPDEVEQRLSDAWALVVPSLWAEPLGLVAVEAVTRGVPVVASARGGLAEIVEDGVSGVLFPNNDEDALVERLSSIASRARFHEQVLPVEAVRRAADTFGLERHITRMRGIFAETAAGASRV